jgi:hypothetical protein
MSRGQLMDMVEHNAWINGFRAAMALASDVCAKPSGRPDDWNKGYDTALRHVAEDIHARGEIVIAESEKRYRDEGGY